MTFFRSKVFKEFNNKTGGMAATQYHRWVTEPSSYEIQVFGEYEPWTIVHRSVLTSGCRSSRL